MKAQALEVQILDFLQAIREAQQLGRAHPNYTEAKEVEGLFTGGADFLRSMFPNPAIQRMVSVGWEAVGQKITPVGYGLDVKTLAFILVGSADAPQAMIAPPLNWAQMVSQDPITQLGALVFVLSQAVDYAHERFLDEPENVKIRAIAYEAEYLKTVKGLSPFWEPCAHQAKVMQEYPDGLSTPKAQKISYLVRPLIQA